MSSDFISWFAKHVNTTFRSEMFDDYIHKELVPLSHLVEKDSKWILEVDLPGVNKKDIDVTLTSSHIVINAKLEEKYCVTKQDCVMEFNYFKKIIQLPQSIDAKRITANYKNGILTVILPKSTTGKRIDVK